MKKKDKLIQIMNSENIKKTEYSLSTHEMAELLNVTSTTVIDWCKKGRIKKVFTTPGGHRRIPFSEYKKLAIMMGIIEPTGGTAQTTPDENKINSKPKKKTVYPIQKNKKK